MIKKFLFALIISFAFCGCITEKTQQFEKCNSDKTCIYMGSDFNQEHYIWENWSFSTNRVDR